jgi:hypothetical protein
MNTKRLQPNRSATFLRNGNWTLLGVAIVAHQKGFVLLTREWTGSRTKYIWECIKKHMWSARIDSLIEGKGCPGCYRDTFLETKDRIIQKRKRNREYCINHKKEKRLYDRAYSSRKMATDSVYKLRHNIRARFRMAIKHGAKSGSSIGDLGCNIQELKLYIESKFQPGMTWNNWSLKGWHIDHVKPLSSFDLSDRKQFLQAVHYTNLQPLWAKDNLSKGSR